MGSVYAARTFGQALNASPSIHQELRGLLFSRDVTVSDEPGHPDALVSVTASDGAVRLQVELYGPEYGGGWGYVLWDGPGEPERGGIADRTDLRAVLDRAFPGGQR